MTVTFSSIVLVLVNLGLVWMLMAAPLGKRTLRVRRTLPAKPETVWSAIHPLGAQSTWHPFVLRSEAGSRAQTVDQSFTHLDRKGAPIVRTLKIDRDVDGGNGRREIATRVVEDSALDASFWKSYSECRSVEPSAGGTVLTIEQTDSYRGLAFLIFRFFAMRREVRALEGWLATGKPVTSGLFEHPVTQICLAVFSTLALWPFLGFNPQGLATSTILTCVILFHELGHLVAYRAFGHKSVRMIFIPFLGGIAIGGRPYNSQFEVAVCAMMGAGVSAFLVPIVILANQVLSLDATLQPYAGLTLVLLLVLGAFNLLNLLPMHRFDGGQVLRQVFRSKAMQVAGSFGITFAILFVGWEIGLSHNALLAALAVFALMSLMGSASVKPRDRLEPMSNGERLVAGFGLYAAILVHGYAVVYACERMFH